MRVGRPTCVNRASQGGGDIGSWIGTGVCVSVKLLLLIVGLIEENLLAPGHLCRSRAFLLLFLFIVCQRLRFSTEVGRGTAAVVGIATM